MKKLATFISVASVAFALTGCSTMFTGTNQEVSVRTHNDQVGSKLDHVAKFTVLGDAYRVKYTDLEAGEIVTLHRKGKPIVVQVQESDCILPTEEHFDAGIHPAVLLDVLATSLLSTSIDSSTGAFWRYDKTLYVTPKIKDTPQCKRWLEDTISKMAEGKDRVPSERDSALNLGGYPYDKNATRHPYGYADQFTKPAKEEKKE